MYTEAREGPILIGNTGSLKESLHTHTVIYIYIYTSAPGGAGLGYVFRLTDSCGQCVSELWARNWPDVPGALSNTAHSSERWVCTDNTSIMPASLT